MRCRFACLILFNLTRAHAETEAPAPPQQVVVTGQTEVEASRDFVAGKIVIDKARIANSGLQNTGELLAREPAISVGKDGRIGLLGLPGYTQVLVDGLPPTGDALTLDLIHVERIEILKSTTAATGPFGIAGTTNIVRRTTTRKAMTQLRTGVTARDGRLGADLAWSSNGQATGGPFNYHLNLSARYVPAPSRSDYRQWRGAAAAPEFDGALVATSEMQSLIASGELTWAPNPAHTLAFSPEAGHIGTTGHSRENASGALAASWALTKMFFIPAAARRRSVSPFLQAGYASAACTPRRIG